MSQFLDHQANDVMPALLDRLEVNLRSVSTVSLTRQAFDGRRCEVVEVSYHDPQGEQQLTFLDGILGHLNLLTRGLNFRTYFIEPLARHRSPNRSEWHHLRTRPPNRNRRYWITLGPYKIGRTN